MSRLSALFIAIPLDQVVLSTTMATSILHDEAVDGDLGFPPDGTIATYNSLGINSYTVRGSMFWEGGCLFSPTPSPPCFSDLDLDAFIITLPEQHSAKTTISASLSTTYQPDLDFQPVMKHTT